MHHFFNFVLKTTEQYTIPLNGIKDGDLHFSFKADNEFFEQFTESEFKQGKFDIEVRLEKCSSLITLHLSIIGYLKVPCDRCLETFDLPVKANQKIVLKFGERTEASGQDYLVLSEDTDSVNIADYIYEFIILEVPLKRVHPEDKKGKSTCDPDMIKLLDEYSEKKNEYIDNRWNELKKLKNGTS